MFFRMLFECADPDWVMTRNCLVMFTLNLRLNTNVTTRLNKVQPD